MRKDCSCSHRSNSSLQQVLTFLEEQKDSFLLHEFSFVEFCFKNCRQHLNFTQESKVRLAKVKPLFKEGKHVTDLIKLRNLWPSIKHKNKIYIKIFLHCHSKKNLKTI